MFVDNSAQYKGTCTICGTEFEKTSQTLKKLTCSKECSKERIRLYRRGNKPLKDQIRDCVVCGTKFSPNSSTQKICSTECRNRNAVYLRREYERDPEFADPMLVIRNKFLKMPARART